MFNLDIKKTFFHQAAVLAGLLALSAPCYGSVVFEDNFDAQANWAQGKPTESGVNYPPFPAAGAPANWSTWRAVPWNPPVADPIAITNSVTSDHTTGSGKQFVARVQACGPDIFSTAFCSDTILAKVLPQEHQELYARFWLKTQPGWKFTANQNNNHKIFRFLRYDGSGAFFQNGTAGSEAPLVFFDLGEYWTDGHADYTFAYRGYPVSSYSGATGTKNNTIQSFGTGTSTASGNWADGQWHRYDIRAKLNTTGTANGVVEFWFDGVKKYSATDVNFKLSGSNSIGWNAFMIGGNHQTDFPAGEQWYAIDDVVISTTPIPDNYVIGGTPVADTTAPTASITYPASNASVSGTVSVNATAADNVAVSKVELYVNNILQSSDTTSPYLLSWNSAALANGTYSLIVKASDAAGNVGQSPAVAVTVSNSQTIDTSAPTVAISAPTNNATVSGTVTVAASATDNVAVSKVEFYDNDAVFAVVNTAPHSVNLDTTKLANGSHSFKSRAYDTTGNVGQSAAVAVTVKNQTQTQDVTAPTVSITSPASNAMVSGNLTISASATDNVGIAKVEFYVNGALHNTDTTAPFSYGGATTSANNGAYTLYAKAYDTAGNVKQSSTVNFTINNGAAADTTAPIASIQAPTSSYVYGTSVAVKAGASDNVAVKKTEIYIDGVLKASANAGSLSWTWILTGYAKGSHVIMIKAYDAAGNVGTKSKTVTKL